MSRHFDVAVIGLGIVGSAVLARLSATRRVVGIDRFTPPHALGSSHGENRIIRGAPGEGRVYAQLARRAFALFGDLEKRTGRTLLHRTGGFDSSTAPSAWAAEVRAICAEEGVAYEALDGRAFNARYPHYALPDEAEIVLQPAFGHVAAEASWQALLDVAHHQGAALCFGRSVEAIDYGEPCRIRLAGGDTILAERVVLAAGSWLTRLVDFPLPLRVERRVLAWYPVERALGEMLPFCFVDGAGNGFWYGMPSLDGRALKIGEHHHLSEATEPDEVAPVGARDTELLNGFMTRWTRGLVAEPVRTATCKYTLTPGGDFIVDRHPAHEGVLILSCCSGHGFKYAPVYGEIVDAMLDGRPYDIDLSRFSLAAHGSPASGREP